MSWLGWRSKSNFWEYFKRQRQNLSKNERWDDFRSIQLRHHFGIQSWYLFRFYCIAYWYCLLAPVIPLWKNRPLLFSCGSLGTWHQEDVDEVPTLWAALQVLPLLWYMRSTFWTRYDNNIYVYMLEIAILVGRCWNSWISNDFSREVLKFMKISSDFNREVLKFMKISSQKHWVYDTSWKNNQKARVFDTWSAGGLYFARVFFVAITLTLLNARMHGFN